LKDGDGRGGPVLLIGSGIKSYAKEIECYLELVVKVKEVMIIYSSSPLRNIQIKNESIINITDEASPHKK